MDLPGQAILPDSQGDHHIESQQRQVGQVVLGELFTLEVGMNAAQAAQAGAGYLEAGELRDVYTAAVTDDNM